MTNEEAIDKLKGLYLILVSDNNPSEVGEAVEMAIIALKAVDEIIDVLFNFGEGAEGELVCRKLLKYGFLKLNNEGDYEVKK